MVGGMWVAEGMVVIETCVVVGGAGKVYGMLIRVLGEMGG